MDEELISREAVRQIYREEVCRVKDIHDLEPFINRIERLPTVNLRKTGHWVEHEIKDTCRWLTCSVCGYEWVNKKVNFCPNCGRRMVEPQESDHKCHTCKHYTSGEHDGSCGSYICKEYSNWESEET